MQERKELEVVIHLASEIKQKAKIYYGYMHIEVHGNRSAALTS